jgi:hypothetical protein
MPDKKQSIPADPLRVDLTEDDEVRYWTEHFGVTEGQLRAAAATIGVRVEDLAAELVRPEYQRGDIG